MGFLYTTCDHVTASSLIYFLTLYQVTKHLNSTIAIILQKPNYFQVDQLIIRNINCLGYYLEALKFLFLIV